MCRVFSVVAVAVVVFSSGCGKSAATKFDTPEAAFQAFQTATEAEDWPTAANCLTAESQTMMADGLILGVSFSTGGDAQKEKEVAALLKKHADAWQPLYATLDERQKLRLAVLAVYGLRHLMYALDEDEEDEE